LPAAVLTKEKLARQRRRSRWKVSECSANWPVAKSYRVPQFAVQLRVGLNDSCITAVRRPGVFRSCGVVSLRLREVETDIERLNPLPPPKPRPMRAPIPGAGGRGSAVLPAYTVEPAASSGPCPVVSGADGLDGRG